LIHPTAYYTLHNIPSGPKLPMAELSIKDSSIPLEAKKPIAQSTVKVTPERKLKQQ